MRARHKDAFLKKHNLKLGFMSAFVKASAFALQEQPVVNAGEFLKTSVAEVFRAVYEYRPAVTFRGLDQGFLFHSCGNITAFPE